MRLRAADCRPYDKPFAPLVKGGKRYRFIYKKTDTRSVGFLCVSYLVKKVVKALYAIYTSILETIS